MAKAPLGTLALQDLHAERDRLLTRLAEVERQIAGTAGEAPEPATMASPRTGRRRKKATKKKVSRRAPVNGQRRGRRGQPALADMLAAAMSRDEPKQMGDLAKELQKCGYRTKSAKLAAMVSQALANDPRFRKVARGQFVLA